MSAEIINETYDEDLGGYSLHVTGGPDDIEVWLNISIDFDGIAIGGGQSRKQAVMDAIDTLERAVKVLKEHA